jgi:hypothetical protein
MGMMQMNSSARRKPEVHEDHRGQQKQENDAHRDGRQEQRVADGGEKVAVGACRVLVEEAGPVREGVSAVEARPERELDHADDRYREDEAHRAEDDPAQGAARLCADPGRAAAHGATHRCHRAVRFCRAE